MRRIAPLAVVLTAMPLLAFGPSERVAPTRWALIIGISDYINSTTRPGVSFRVPSATCGPSGTYS